jgi:predicted PurR-regulated permease PerM
MNDVEGTRTIIERWIGSATVVVLALACLLILRPFISAAFWAAILCFTTWPLFISLRTRLGGRQTMAASLATLALSVLIVAPIVFLVSRLSSNIADIINATRRFIQEGPTAPPRLGCLPPARRWSVRDLLESAEQEQRNSILRNRQVAAHRTESGTRQWTCSGCGCLSGSSQSVDGVPLVP